MSEELKITKERVLEAASKCGTAKEVLKTLWPDVFLEKLKLKDISIQESLTDGDFIITYGAGSRDLIIFHSDGTFSRYKSGHYGDHPFQVDSENRIIERK